MCRWAPARRAHWTAQTGRRTTGSDRVTGIDRLHRKPKSCLLPRRYTLPLARASGRTGPAAGAHAHRNRRVLLHELSYQDRFGTGIEPATGRFWQRLYPMSYPKVCEPGIEPGKSPRLAHDRSLLRRHTHEQQTEIRFLRTGGISTPTRGPLQRGCGQAIDSERRANAVVSKLQ